MAWSIRQRQGIGRRLLRRQRKREGVDRNCRRNFPACDLLRRGSQGKLGRALSRTTLRWFIRWRDECWLWGSGPTVREGSYPGAQPFKDLASLRVAHVR